VRTTLLLVMVAACVSACGGGNGANQPDATPPGVFGPKAGNWNGDDGCQDGRLLLIFAGPTLTLYLGSLANQIYVNSVSADATNPDAVDFDGTYSINGSDASWSCVMTCVSASSITLACTNMSDASKNCTESFSR
jgi:hypothetical protein